MKNTLIEFIHTPVKLILMIVTEAIIIGTVIFVSGMPNEKGVYLEIAYFKGLCFVYMLFFTFFDALKGLIAGHTLFDMSDVNLLFPAPVSPKKVLVYGMAGKMAKTMGTAFMVILVQSRSLKYFGIDARGVVFMLLFCAAGMLPAFMLAQVIYVFTNGNKNRKLAVIIIIAALFIPLIIQIILQVPKYDIAAALGLLSTSPLVDFFPIAGWAAAGCMALLVGNMFAALCFLGLLLLTSAGLALFIALSKMDFYEDALYTSEALFEKRRAELEDDISKVMYSFKKINVKKTGLNGAGCAAFFYRHLREASRRSIVPLLNGVSLFYIGGVALSALFIRDTFGGDTGVITVLSSLLFLQILCIVFGEGLKELSSPYIYLIPERALSKIIWTNMTTFLRTLLEGVLIFALAGAILRAHISTLCLAALAYSFFSFKIIALNYFSHRWTGVGIGTGVFITLYMLVAVLTSLPGAIIGLVAGILLNGAHAEGALGYFIGLLLFCAWELITGFAGFALSAGILDNCDISAVKSGKE
jgi:hypothetical protein